MQRIQWVIKVSRLCNLRCRYCYEWEGLADPKRLSLADWERLLEAIACYQRAYSARRGQEVGCQLIWHGGEPLLLPRDYIEAVLDRQRRILGRDGVEYSNTIQTNLYRIDDEMLSLLKREGFTVGISFDVVSGARVDVAGSPTEARIRKNFDKLRAAAIAFGGIAVLAAHTASRIEDVYDFYEAEGIALRVLPLFRAPQLTAESDLAVSEDEVVAALGRLFVHWFERGCPIRVAPLDSYLINVLMKLAGLSRPPYDPWLGPDIALIVHTDGALHKSAENDVPEAALGNVLQQTMEEILASDAFARGLERSARRVARSCGQCPYLGPCDTLPIHQDLTPRAQGARCAIAYRVQSFIEDYLALEGFVGDAIRELASDVDLMSVPASL